MAIAAQTLFAKTVKWVLAFAGWAVGLFCFALFIANRPAQPDLKDPHNWTLIKRYRGPLGDSAVDVIALAYIYKRPYFEVLDDHYQVLQNRVEIRNAEGQMLADWMWPGEKVEYAAGWCEILDANNDGRKEILLFDGLKSIRLVAYENGRLYEPRNSKLESVEYEVGPRNLDSDSRFEFIEDQAFYPDVHIPRIYHWDAQLGFRDVSRNFPEFYKSEVIPEMERKASRSQPRLQELYRKAIDSIRKDVLRTSAG